MRSAAIRRIRARGVPLLACAVTMLLVAATSVGEAYASSSVTFTSPGEYVFTVPAGVTTLHVVATGDNGSNLRSPIAGGAGAIVTSDLAVVPGEVLYVEVGLGGGASGGGGESDVRTCPVSSCAGLGTSHDPRLVVAGGGGASSYFGGGAAGGALTGSCNGGVFAAGASAPYGYYEDATGVHPSIGGGGGCTSGGAGAIWFGSAQGSGGPGAGGTGGSGGGAGYFGGGASVYWGSFPGGGGGGSSFGPTGSTFALRPPAFPGCMGAVQCVPAGGGSVVLSFGQDTTPPQTTASLNGRTGQNGWYVGPVTLVLTASDPDVGNVPTSGVASTNYSLDGGATWLAYSPQNPPTVSADGRYTIQYRSTDVAGNVEAARTIGVNIDQAAPTVACGMSPDMLWPPNHKLVDVAASVTVQDAMSGPAGFTLTSVSSSESDTPAADMQQWTTGTPDVAGQLAASRAGDGAGRTYTLVYTAADQAGNTATCSTTVVVPHDQR